MEKNQKNKVIVVRVAEIVRLLIKKLWIMVLAGAIFAAAGYGYGVVTTPTPMYSATTKLYVTGVEVSVPSSAGIGLGQQVINNYIEILESKPVLEQVIENLNLNMSYVELRNCISETVPTETCMLAISVTFPDPEWAKKVSDELVTVSAARALEIMGCTAPTVYEEAYIPTEPSNAGSSSSLKFMLLGGFAGVALAGFAVLVSYFANTKFNNPNKVTDKLCLKNLGVLPDSKAKNAAFEEAAYQNFGSRLFFEKPDARIIDFVSATEKENKYTFIQKAADSLQKAGKKVIVLDTNLSNPKWGAADSADANQKGLESYLTGKAQLEDIIVEKEGTAGIYCTETAMNAPELLSGEVFSKLLEQLKLDYDYILVDTAPMIYVPDALCVAEKADAVVLALSAKTSRTCQAKQVMTLLQEKEIPITGAVIKDMDIQKGGRYFRKEFGMYFGVYEK